MMVAFQVLKKQIKVWSLRLPAIGHQKGKVIEVSRDYPDLLYKC